MKMVLTVLAACGWLSCSIFAATNGVSPLSVPNVESRTPPGGSFLPSFTADGSRVVFVSHAASLVTNDGPNLGLDVFVYSIASDTIELVSVAASGTGGSDRDSNYPVASSNGQVIAYASTASNLAPDDTNGVSDVFARDLSSHATRLVTAGTAGEISVLSNPVIGSFRPAVTPDGRWVAFESGATNLVSGDTNGLKDIFLRDLAADSTVAISVGARRTHPWTAESTSPAVSFDARRVAFVSTAAELVPGISNRFGEIYVRDVSQQCTLWASSNCAAYFLTGYGCSRPVLSTDGNVVIFVAQEAFDGPRTILFRHVLDTGVTTALATNVSKFSWPTLSADGCYVAFEDGANIFRWSSQTLSNGLVNLAADNSGPADGESRNAVMTPDGRFIAFVSTSTNLVSNLAANTNAQFQVYLRDMDSGMTRLVSVNTNGQPSQSSLDETVPTVTADGRLVAFDSPADDLVPGDLNRAPDVFIRDLENTVTRLVSEVHPDVQLSTAMTHSTFTITRSPRLKNGVLAFDSLDNNLVAGDTNETPDIYVCNLTNGVVQPVSLPEQNVLTTNQIAWGAVLSEDGSKVLFYRGGYRDSSVYLYSQDSTNQWLFVRDIAAGTTEQVFEGPVVTRTFQSVSRHNLPAINSNGTLVVAMMLSNSQLYAHNTVAGTNWALFHVGGPRYNPIFSPDGEWIIFEDDNSGGIVLTNPVPGPKLVARNIATRQDFLIAAGSCTGAVVTASRRHLIFYKPGALAASVPSSDAFLYDWQTKAPATRICTNCAGVTLDAYNRFAVFQRIYGSRDVWVKDLQTGEETTLFSRGSGTVVPLFRSPAISRHGRYIAFGSEAGDLVPDDTNNVSDVFIYDRARGATFALTRGLNGNTASGGSSSPIMSSDGRTVVFQSNAGDLVPGDRNTANDIFVVRLSSGDSDNDGLEDEWEWVYFLSLARDGNGDHDGDGHSDRNEFLAGSDPTNENSVFEVLTVSSPGSGVATIHWRSTPGRTYRPQYKETTDSVWRDLPGFVTADATTAHYTDMNAVTDQRYYRVVLVETD